MTIEEARELIGEDADALSDEMLERLMTLARLVCEYVITTDDGMDWPESV